MKDKLSSVKLLIVKQNLKLYPIYSFIKSSVLSLMASMELYLHKLFHRIQSIPLSREKFYSSILRLYMKKKYKNLNPCHLR